MKYMLFLWFTFIASVILLETTWYMYKLHVFNIFLVNLSILEKVKNNFIWQKNNRRHIFVVAGYFLVGKYNSNCWLLLLIKRAAVKLLSYFCINQEYQKLSEYTDCCKIIISIIMFRLASLCHVFYYFPAF